MRTRTVRLAILPLQGFLVYLVCANILAETGGVGLPLSYGVIGWIMVWNPDDADYFAASRCLSFERYQQETWKHAARYQDSPSSGPRSIQSRLSSALRTSGCVGAMDFSLQNIVGEGSVFVVDDHYDVTVA